MVLITVICAVYLIVTKIMVMIMMTTKMMTTKMTTTKMMTTKIMTTKMVTTKMVTTKRMTTKVVTTKMVTTKMVTTKMMTTKMMMKKINLVYFLTSSFDTRLQSGDIQIIMIIINGNASLKIPIKFVHRNLARNVVLTRFHTQLVLTWPLQPNIRV